MANLIEIRVPDIGDFDAVDVVEVLVAPGDTVANEDPLISLESDKASMEVPSSAAGTVREVKTKVGDQVSEGTVIVVLEADEAAASAPKEAAKPAAPAPAPSPAPAPAPVAAPAPAPARPRTLPSSPDPLPPGQLPHASPSVRRFARELGVDLTQVGGSGRKGRITKDDVKAFVKQAMSRPAGGGSGGALPEMPVIDFSKFGEVEHKALSRIKKVSAANLHRSWLHVPHVTQFDEADITEMEAFRKAHGEEAKKRGFKLTPLVFLMKAVVAGLKTWPDFNSSLDPTGENLILKKYFHIGIAVDTPKGLVVPVVRDVDQKSLYELAAELGEISVRARDGKLKPGEMQGGCFTISSLGGIGGTAFTPIVNAPEVAILGVSRSAMKQVYRDGAFVPRLMLPLSLSYDHRVIDGAAAARFTTYLSGVLSDIRRLLL